MFVTKEQFNAVGVYANPEHEEQKNPIPPNTKILVMNDSNNNKVSFR
jgi:hypothetical protein